MTTPVPGRSRRLRSPLLRGAVVGACALVLGPLAAAQENQSQPDASATSDEDADGDWQLRFNAIEEVRLRAALAPDEVDEDGRLYLSSGLIDPSGRFDGDLALGLWGDFNGVPAADAATGFAEVHDVRNPPVWFDVYALSAGYNTGTWLTELRAGRQTIDRGTPIAIDGASVRIRPWERVLELFAFGGRSVHYFELNEGLFEDWVGSVGAEVRPLPDVKLQLDYRLLREDAASAASIVNNSYGIAGWYRLGDWVQARAYLRGVDLTLSQVGGALRVVWPGQDLGAEFSVHAQPMELRELNELDDPYFAILGASQPYLRWRATVFKGFATDFGTYGVQLGGTGRHLLAGSEGPFNRNFGRLFAQATASDIVVKGPFVNLVLERDSDRFDLGGHGVWSVGGAAGYQARWLRGELGSSYDQYKYTYFHSVDELQDVRTFYGELSVRPKDFLTVRARYQFERFAWDVHTLWFSLAQAY